VVFWVNSLLASSRTSVKFWFYPDIRFALDNENNNNTSTFQSKLLCFKATVRVSLSHYFGFKKTKVSLFYLICPAILPNLSPLLSAGMLLLSFSMSRRKNWKEKEDRKYSPRKM
jgi:hypothetical protein